MKVIFRKFFNFFTQGPQQCHRQKDKTPQHARQVGQQIAQLQGPAAEQEEVPDRAQEDGADVEEADPSVPHGNGEHEEGDGHRQPEQQVQRAPQQGQAYPDPEHPEQVVQHPHQGPQHQGGGKGEGLPGHRDLHGPPPQRNSRENSPPLSRPLSS